MCTYIVLHTPGLGSITGTSIILLLILLEKIQLAIAITITVHCITITITITITMYTVWFGNFRGGGGGGLIFAIFAGQHHIAKI